MKHAIDTFHKKFIYRKEKSKNVLNEIYTESKIKITHVRKRILEIFQNSVIQIMLALFYSFVTKLAHIMVTIDEVFIFFIMYMLDLDGCMFNTLFSANLCDFG